MAIKLVSEIPVGNMMLRTFDIDGPNPYTVGGQVYTANQLYTSRIMQVWLSGGIITATGAPGRAMQAYLQANTGTQGSPNVKIVMCTTVAGGTEAGAIDLSATQFRLCVLGSPN